jgi:hypothetical protein
MQAHIPNPKLLDQFGCTRPPHRLHCVLCLNHTTPCMVEMAITVATLALGSRPRQRLTRVRAKRSVRECEDEDSHSQVSSHFGKSKSQWTPEPSESNCRGQNTFHWRILYIIIKLWKCRCLKWARMTHLDICNTSYGKKKGQESNWQFDSRP